MVNFNYVFTLYVSGKLCHSGEHNIYFYTKNIEAFPFVYLQSEVLTTISTLKMCAGLLIRQITIFKAVMLSHIYLPFAIGLNIIKFVFEYMQFICMSIHCYKTLCINHGLKI